MMRFVTGGACQGKHAFVSEKFPQEMCITIKEEQILENMSAGIDTILQLQKEIVAAELPERQAIVIMNETGSGITPMELSQRKLRDEMGKIGCALAAEAEEVYRVIAGIGIQIK